MLIDKQNNDGDKLLDSPLSKILLKLELVKQKVARMNSLILQDRPSGLHRSSIRCSSARLWPGAHHPDQRDRLPRSERPQGAVQPLPRPRGGPARKPDLFGRVLTSLPSMPTLTIFAHSALHRLSLSLCQDNIKIS